MWPMTRLFDHAPGFCDTCAWMLAHGGRLDAPHVLAAWLDLAVRLGLEP